MYTEELRKIVKKIVTDIPSNNLVAHHKQIRPYIKDIIECTPFLDNKCKLTERLYCILHDISIPMLCKNCNITPVKFFKISEGYRTYCKKCVNKSKQVRINRIRTFRQKYGVDNPSQSEEIKNKKIQTSLSNYGVEHYSKTDEAKQCKLLTIRNRSPEYKNYIRNKTKQTCINRYGTESYSKTNECKDKVKQTCINKYGVESSNQSPDVMRKKEQTCLARFGVKYSTQSNVMKEKSKQTCLSRYGVDNPTKSAFFVRKAIETRIRNHGDLYCPNIGSNEKQLLDEAEIKDKCKILRAYRVGLYYLDGYCPETNTAYEVYEKHHYRPQKVIYDSKRIKEIKHRLGCKFVIIKDC